MRFKSVVGLAGGLVFSVATAGEIPTYGIEHLKYITKPHTNYLFLGYDIDGDGEEDIRELREHIKGNLGRPLYIWYDENDDGEFTENEQHKVGKKVGI